MPNDQIILVTGATGHQGGAVARHLLKQGFLVRALVRDSGKQTARDLAGAGAEVVEGDFDDRASLDKAMNGVHGTFSVQDFYAAGTEGEIQQGKNMADAAARARVRHFIYSSVGSAHRETGVPHFQTKWRIEEHIRSIRLPHTIFRPVFFYYNYEQMREQITGGTLAQPLSPRRSLQQLSEDDYGMMVATALKHPQRFLGRALDVASSEPAMTDLAGIFSRVTGRPVEYRQVRWEEFQQQAGPEVTAMYRWFENTGYNVDFDEMQREFGKLTDLDEYLRAHGWARQPSRAPA